MWRVAKPSGKVYFPVSGKAIDVHASQSSTVPVMSMDCGKG
jgi:hypothetical protein